MNLLDQFVETALETDSGYAALRPVVEKEILHFDILREMNKAGYLKELVFIGGTCLRKCYGSERLSEDLDFSGGFNFKKDDLAGIGILIKEGLYRKYQFPAEVSEPEKETGNTSTWKIKVVTRPERPTLPMQRINIDVFMLPSYDITPVILKNHYGIEQGTSGLILYAESLQEILTDKLIAFALRRGRVKNRDLWDIFWLSRQNISWSASLLEKKLADREIPKEAFISKYAQRLEDVKHGQKDFLSEMSRFLNPAVVTRDIGSTLWWDCLLGILSGMMRVNLN